MELEKKKIGHSRPVRPVEGSQYLYLEREVQGGKLEKRRKKKETLKDERAT